MTPDESRLLNDLLDRLARLPAPVKDAEADALIRAAMIKLPDAPYQLVQAYLLHEQAAAHAKQRLEDLENENQRLRQQVQMPPQPAPAPAYQQPSASPWGAPSVPRGSGGFLQTAAGVAGGMLLAEGVSSLFFGHRGFSPWGMGGGGFLGGGFLGGGPSIIENNTIVNETVNNTYDDNSGGDDGGSDMADSGGWDSGGSDDSFV